MIEISAGVEQLQVIQGASGLLVPVGDAAPSFANQAGEQGVGTLFNLAEMGLRLLLGIIAFAGIIYASYSGFLFMRAAGNPQMLDRARMQLILAVVGVVIALSAQLVVGATIEFVFGASGGTIADVGDVSKVQTSGATVPSGSFLGIYQGSAVICPSDLSTGGDIDATDPDGAGTASAAWTIVKDVGCQKKP